MDSRKELFRKLLKELAGQLWQAQLQEALENDHLRLCIPIRDQRHGIRSHGELFETLLAFDLISPSDISLLTNILEKQGESHLLWPLYEAGFGRVGLRRGSKDYIHRSGETPAIATSTNSSRALPTQPLVPLASAQRSATCMRSRSFNLGRKSHKHGPAHAEFKELLRSIGTQISEEDLSALAFLCQDVISRSQLEQVSSGIDLFRALRKRRCITDKRLEFLYRILRDCGRLDLSHLVDSYVYLNLKQGSSSRPLAAQHEADPPGDNGDEEVDGGGEGPGLLSSQKQTAADYSSDSDTLTYGGGRNYQFRMSLKQLGDRLGHSDLQSMKVLSAYYVPESKLERVKTVFDLFVLLEERGKLSADDLSFLEELLEEKQHLIDQLYAKGFGQKMRKHLQKVKGYKNGEPTPFQGTAPVYIVFSAERTAMSFKRLLRAVGSQLTKHDISQLIFLCPDDVFLAGQEEIESGLELFVLLEKRQIISPVNVDFLLRNLESVGRKDLCRMVTMYKSSIPVTPRNSFRSSFRDSFPERRSPLRPQAIKRSVSLDSAASRRSSCSEREVNVNLVSLEQSAINTHTHGLSPISPDPSTEVDGPLESVQLRALKEELEGARAKHEREKAKLTEEFLRKQIELQEKNTTLYEKLLGREETIHTLSHETLQKANILKEELENQRRTIAHLSARTVRDRTSRTSERRERRVLEARLHQRDEIIKRISKRVTEQEVTIQKLASTAGLQVYVMKGLKSTEV